MPLTINATITLNNGQKMPQLGLGVYKMPPGKATEQAVRWALEAGYRHIDTAKFYSNEASVGQAVRDSGIARDKVWITTKLWPTDFLHPRKAFEASLKRLGMDYVDLYLLHFPAPVMALNLKLWAVLESLVGAGLCKSIGVSNYSAGQLQKVLSQARIKPVVNQVRCSPFNYPKELHEFCQQQGVAFEAYSPLTQGSQLDNQALRAIADKYHKSSAQVLLRWALQQGMIVIPKSQHQERIKENADIYDFELSANDMTKLSLL